MRWGDMDAYGHINNVELVRMLEEARIAAFGPPAVPGCPGSIPQVSLFNDVPGGHHGAGGGPPDPLREALEYRNVPAAVRYGSAPSRARASTFTTLCRIR